MGERFTAEQIISKLRDAEVLLARDRRWARHQRRNSPGRRHWILSLRVDFKGSRI